MIREYVVKVTDAVVPGAFQRFESTWAPEQELVRCKDCVKRRLCCIRRTDDPEWFCGDGEREDENG